jgi:TIR domain
MGTVEKIFAYDVAISFAGEQRRDAEEIANRLRAAGVTVFYDAYEQADLWGKNLYDHLAVVYQHKARYCLMLVSAAYAAKVWTTHERQSAQARALTQNTEYILPVRFDDTDVPGLLDTIGYVRFADYGIEGIADLISQKLGTSAPPQAALASVSTSPRACILDTHQNLQAWVPVTRCTWGNTEATLTLQPDDPTDGPFLDGLRSSKHQLLIALKHNVGLCRVTEVQHEFADGRDQWVIHLRIEQADFTPGMEMGMNNLSADQIAEQRARRILLNENPSRDTNDWNQAAVEVLLRGMQTPLQAKASPFPALYGRFGSDQRMFLEVAWITAVMTLKTTAVIAEATTLDLALEGNRLRVKFTGKRYKQYTNQPATVITVNGHCALS